MVTDKIIINVETKNRNPKGTKPQNDNKSRIKLKNRKFGI